MLLVGLEPKHLVRQYTTAFLQTHSLLVEHVPFSQHVFACSLLAEGYPLDFSLAIT